jgi:hypothetical protein
MLTMDTNHMKLAVADAGDHVLDSNALLRIKAAYHLRWRE